MTNSCESKKLVGCGSCTANIHSKSAQSSIFWSTVLGNRQAVQPGNMLCWEGGGDGEYGRLFDTIPSRKTNLVYLSFLADLRKIETENG